MRNFLLVLFHWHSKIFPGFWFKVDPPQVCSKRKRQYEYVRFYLPWDPARAVSKTRPLPIYFMKTAARLGERFASVALTLRTTTSSFGCGPWWHLWVLSHRCMMASEACPMLSGNRNQSRGSGHSVIKDLTGGFSPTAGDVNHSTLATRQPG